MRLGSLRLHNQAPLLPVTLQVRRAADAGHVHVGRCLFERQWQVAQLLAEFVRRWVVATCVPAKEIEGLGSRPRVDMNRPRDALPRGAPRRDDDVSGVSVRQQALYRLGVRDVVEYQQPLVVQAKPLADSRDGHIMILRVFLRQVQALRELDVARLAGGGVFRGDPPHAVVRAGVAVGVFRSYLRLADAAQAVNSRRLRQRRAVACVQRVVQRRQDVLATREVGVAAYRHVPRFQAFVVLGAIAWGNRRGAFCLERLPDVQGLFAGLDDVFTVVLPRANAGVE
jgi:hypothetical protein